MNIHGKEITIGADPEIFVAKQGSFVCAHNMVPGTKTEPFKVNKGAVQVDGMALEFNIDPASDYEEFQNNLDEVQKTLKQMIGDHEFLQQVSVKFEADLLKALPLEAVILGCDPDYNAYTGECNEPPNGEVNMRTVGGHIHIGNIFEEGMKRRDRRSLAMRMGRLMDKYVGIYSILWDKDDDRRSMYGKGGCFRVKPYGMEYRTMSNAWLFNKNITKFVYEGTMKAVKGLIEGEDVKDTFYKDIIDNSDRGNSFFKEDKTHKELMGVLNVC